MYVWLIISLQLLVAVGKDPNTFTVVANERVNLLKHLPMAGEESLRLEKDQVKLLREDEGSRGRKNGGFEFE